MIEVRIRLESEAKAVHLTDVHFDDLDDVIPTIKGWGVADHEDRDLTGQIVVAETESYFEVIVHDFEDGAA